MNKFKTNLSLLTLVFFFLMAIASSGVSKMTFSKSDGQIPPDFGYKSDTLLIIKTTGFGDYNKYVREAFEKNYTGAYKIIKDKELKDYPTEKYRFTFELVIELSSPQMVMTSNGGWTTSRSRTTKCITSDRKTGKSYSTASTAFYGKLLSAYIPALNKELKN
jgi:hypothetical protein